MALPDDGRTDIGDLVTIGNAISAAIAPAFKQASFGLNLVHAQTCPLDTNVIKFRKSGSLVAEAVAEGQVYAPSDANSDINDTSVTATAVKVMVASPISAEALRFTGGQANFARFSSEQGRALGRYFDNDLCSLFDGVANVATATSTLDTDTILTGQYNVNAALCPPGRQVCVLDHKGLLEIKKQLSNTGAAIYSSQYNHPLFGTPEANGYQGSLLNIDFYSSPYLTTTGGDDQGCIFNPEYAFAAALGGSIETQIVFTGVGVASQVPGVSYQVISWMFYDLVEWNDTAACEIRSDT